MTAVPFATNVFECFLCPQVLFPTPEDFCLHMRHYHDMRNMEVQSIVFSNRQSFQDWLHSVEDCRGQPGGYVQPNSGPGLSIVPFQDEYYVLCPKKYRTLKRRRISERVSGDQIRDNAIQHVVCSAFLHVTENANGSVYVRFCLEHCGHPVRQKLPSGTESNCTNKQRSGRLKRNSSSARGDSEDEDYESEETIGEENIYENNHLASRHSPLPGPSSKSTSSGEVKSKISTHRMAVLSTVGDKLETAKASISSIMQMEDSALEQNEAEVKAQIHLMAKQMQAVTQVLSDLAVDASPPDSFGPMDI